MARARKNSRHIIVEGVAFSWRAAGDDGCITLTIWPDILGGASICAHFGYHETWLPRGGGTYSSAGDQIVVTNRLVRRVILHAIEQFSYDPARKGKLIRIPQVDQRIKIDDAGRACQPTAALDRPAARR
jgi:hypothetical protein